MATSTVSPQAQVAVKKTATKKVFDLDTFQKVSKSVEYEVPADLQDPSELRHYDPKELLNLVNKGRKRQALLTAKASIQGADASIVSKVLSGFKLFPKYHLDNFESRAEQDAAIMGMLRSNPGVFELIKSQVVEAQNSGVESDEEDED